MTEFEIYRHKALTKYFGGDELATNVLIDKYLLPIEDGPEHMWTRLAKAAATVEKEPAEHELSFNNLLSDFKFIPGGRIMYALGREEKVSCTNCYVIPIKFYGFNVSINKYSTSKASAWCIDDYYKLSSSRCT